MKIEAGNLIVDTENLPSIEEIKAQEILEMAEEIASLSEPFGVEDWIVELLVRTVIHLDRESSARR